MIFFERQVGGIARPLIVANFRSCGGKQMDIRSYPRISAHRGDLDEEWRNRRIHALLSMAGRAAGTSERRHRLRRSILRIRDDEGDLTILWDGKYHDDDLVLLVRDAWRRLGQFTPTRHLVEYS